MMTHASCSSTKLALVISQCSFKAILITLFISRITHATQNQMLTYAITTEFKNGNENSLIE